MHFRQCLTPFFKQNQVSARVLTLKQTSNNLTSPASESEYSFKKFASRQYKVQTFKRARVKFIATTIKATKQVKTIKQVEIDIKQAWLFIQVSVKSSSKSSERLNKYDRHQASMNSKA